MPVTAIFVARAEDPEAMTLQRRLVAVGHAGLRQVTIERVYRLESDDGAVDVAALMPLFVNPSFESAMRASALDPAAGPIVEIGYRPAVTDPETPSILAGAHALGQTGVVWARLAHRYQFVGLTPAEASAIARENLYNPIVQDVIPAGREFTTLRPTGAPDPVREVSLRGLNDADLATLSTDSSWYAPVSQMRALQSYEARIGRPLTDAEIEIVVQSWSDHCYHTTWRSLGLLQRLMAATRQIDHPDIVSVFKDNAGGMILGRDSAGEEWVVTMKGETHNFPSSIAPFGGVATKHGGVIRDSIGFGKGAFAIGGSTVMGTMDPRLAEADVPPGALHPRHLLLESIRATSYYCNPMGIPMMYPIYRAHSGFPKCLALGHSVGLIPRRYALKDAPRSGDLVFLAGGRTGRDGLHGATASSAHMTAETITKEAAAVQIGHPITERKIMEAIPALRDAGCIRSVTDLGAGGLSCAAGEMGEPTGIRIDLDRVRLKDASLAPWEILLSESQERMLIAVPPEKRGEAEAILARYDVEATVVGEFTDTLRYEAYRFGERVVNLDMPFLWGACPIDEVEVRAPLARNLDATPAEPDIADLPEWAARVVGHYHCCDQSAAGFQFDSTVQGRTVIGPYGGVDGRMPTGTFVSAPLRGDTIGVASAVAFNPFYGELSPAGLARLAILEAVAKAVAVGADPDAISLCDNFYTPKATPEVNWALTEMVDAIADLSIRLRMPFISGKDSSSGTFRASDGRTIDVPLTLAVATLARVPDVRRVVTKELKAAGDRLVLLGAADFDRLGGTVYLDARGTRGDALADPGADVAAGFLAAWRRLHALYGSPKCPVRAATAVGEGGLLVRAFEMATGGGLGVAIDLAAFGPTRWDGALFAEPCGSILVEVSAGADPAGMFAGLPWIEVGRVTDQPTIRVARGDGPIADLSLADLSSVWSKPFAEVVL